MAERQLEQGLSERGRTTPQGRHVGTCYTGTLWPPLPI